MATSNAATTFLEYRLLSYVFKNNAAGFDSPGDNLWVGLATAISDAEVGSLTEVNTSTQDSNYVRKQVTASNWTISSSSTDTATVKNTNNLEWSISAGESSYTVTHVFIASASSGGNIYFVGQLTTSRTITKNDIFRINANDLIIELK